jgi:hypothetical protein
MMYVVTVAGEIVARFKTFPEAVEYANAQYTPSTPVGSIVVRPDKP